MATLHFDIESSDMLDSLMDYEKIITHEIRLGMNINDHILSSAPTRETAASIGTLLGVPVNLHNYPNIGFQKELTLREILQKEIDKWLC